MRSIKLIFRLMSIMLIVWKKFCHDNCFMRAGSLAYVTLLSLVPLFTLSFSILSAFPMFKGLDQKVENLIFNNFVADSAQTIQGYIHIFMEQTGRLSVIGLVFLLITAVLIVFTMEQTFNAIWNVRRNRQGATAFLIYWAVITLIPIFTATALWITDCFTVLPWLTHLSVVAPYVAIFIAFTFLYIALPNCKVAVRPALIAALIGTILFELARKAFAIYIINFATYTVIYGALASVPIFLLWVYVSWVVILFGAVASNVLNQQL